MLGLKSKPSQWLSAVAVPLLAAGIGYLATQHGACTQAANTGATTPPPPITVAPRIDVSPTIHTVIAPAVQVATERAPAAGGTAAKRPPGVTARRSPDWRNYFPATKRCVPRLVEKADSWFLVCSCPKGDFGQSQRLTDRAAAVNEALWERARAVATAETWTCP